MNDGKGGVDGFVDGILGMSKAFGNPPAENKSIDTRALIRGMVALRERSGLSPMALAERMNRDVKVVLKIEALDDQEDMTLKEFRQYVEGLGLVARVMIQRRTAKD